MEDNAGAESSEEKRQEVSRVPITVDQHLHVSARKSLTYRNPTRE
jgi:hypothetical protein